MVGQLKGTGKRTASIVVGLGLILTAAASAGEVTLRSNRRVKVNVGGRRVIGTFSPEDPIFVDGLDRGTHKIYVKDLATGGFDLIFVDLPAQDGEQIRVDFGTRVNAAAAPVATQAQAPASRGFTPEQPPAFADTGEWRREMGKLFDLHEVSLDTLEAMQSQLDRMKSSLAQAPARPAPARRDTDEGDDGERDAGKGLHTYMLGDVQWSENNLSPDHGQFDLNQVYLGGTGRIDGYWTGRAEVRLENGLDANGTRTVGEAELSRAYLTRTGATTTFTVGKIFNPFGFFSARQQEIYNDTIQNPLAFDNLYAPTQTGAHWQFLRHGNHIAFGLFNGEGPTPDSVDTNDDKSFLASWERKDFMNGRVGLAYNRQRDGNQGDRREEKWMLSTEQKWKDVKLVSEYLLEKAGRVGGTTNNDSFYSDLRYDITERWNTTLRYDWIRRDPKAANDEHTRKLINFGYAFNEALRFKADYYHDDFAAAGMADRTGLDLQLAAAIGL